MELSTDIALIIQLDWQTKFIRRWIKRPKVWPNMHDLSTVTNVTYVISKTSHEEKNLTESTEFRYSFAHIERKIVSLQSKSQRLVYYIAKSIFNRWIKPIDSNVVTSFMLKNTMLWMCEKYSPENEIWGSEIETKKILNIISKLYSNLLKNLKENY